MIRAAMRDKETGTSEMRTHQNEDFSSLYSDLCIFF